MDHGTRAAEMTAGIAVVDAHIHQWDPFTTPRLVSLPAKLLRRVPPLQGPVMRVFPARDREFVGDPAWVMRPYLPADHAHEAGLVQIDSVVHIEAGWQSKHPEGAVDETRWVAALPWGRGTPALGAIVVHADPREAGCGALLDTHLAASDRVRGVRFVASSHPDKGVRSWQDAPDVLASPEFLRGFSALAERGLSFDLWCFHEQLPFARRLVAEYPETTFVLDHYATPVGACGQRGATGRTPAERAAILGRWRDEIDQTAALANVVAKHSGLGMPLLGLAGDVRPELERTRDALAPLIRHVHDAFGPSRTLWSSNYPIDAPGLALPDSISILADVLGDDLDAAAVFSTNARRVYRL